MKIVFDTNIIYKDFSMSNSIFKTFFDGLNHTGYSLHIPQVVYDEVVNKYSEKLRNSRRIIENEISKLARFVIQEFDQPITNAEIKNLEKKYRDLLNAKLAESQARFLDYPNISHQDIVQRALQRKRPFNKKGAGYRDTLIWQSILELVTSEPIQPIAFISTNTKDFADEDGSLHPDLLNDVQLLGEDTYEVNFFPDLESFVNKHIKPTMKILEDIQTQLASNEHPDLNLKTFIVEELISFVRGVEFEYRKLNFLTEFETPNLSKIKEVYDIIDIDVRQLSTGELIISFSASVLAEFDFFVYKADYYVLSDEDQRLIWEHDWNEHYMAGSTSKKVYLELSLTFDTASKQVTSGEIIDISPVKKLGFVELGKIFEEFSRRQSQQIAKRLVSSHISSKALEPLSRINDELKKMLEDIGHKSLEKISKLFESFKIPDEMFKGIPRVTNLKTPTQTNEKTDENEDISLDSNGEEDASEDEGIQDEE